MRDLIKSLEKKGAVVVLLLLLFVGIGCLEGPGGRGGLRLGIAFFEEIFPFFEASQRFVGIAHIQVQMDNDAIGM